MARYHEQPLEERYEEEPTHAPVDHPAFNPVSDEWVNYGDANPFDHGGRFLKWDGSQWRLLVTTPPSGTPFDDHLFEEYYFGPRDVWMDPNDPWTDFTDDMKTALKALGADHHLPVAPPFLKQVDYYVVDLMYHTRMNPGDEYVTDDPEMYWSEVEFRLPNFNRDNHD